jgi:DNA-directed RNA polymerase specialized sigma24 family protein
MSDSDNTTRDAASVCTLISAIFDPGFPEVLVDEPTPEASKVPVIASAGATADPPSWDDIKQKQWSDIEARYEDGKRDKETVCAWMPYKAALGVCKGWPQGSFDELVLEGYQAAVRRWDAAYAPYVDPGTAPDEKSRKAIKKANALRYDPTKDKGNGIPGLVYTAAEGHMRNVAHKLFTKHGKRKHDKDDVLPVVTGLVDGLASHEAPEIRNPASVAKVDAYFADDTYSDDTTPADSFTNKADVGGINDKAVTAAAKKAARGKEKPSKVKPDPTLVDRNATRAWNERAEIDAQQLISMLPSKDDQKLITQYWGLEGRANSMTIEELAEAGGISEETVRNRLDKLLIELRLLAPRTPRQIQGAWRARAEGRRQVAPLRGAA